MTSCLSSAPSSTGYCQRRHRSVNNVKPARGGGGGGGALTCQMGRGCRWGFKTGPCHKPLGAQKIHPVTIYLTKNFHMHTLLQYCTPRIDPVLYPYCCYTVKRNEKLDICCVPPGVPHAPLLVPRSRSRACHNVHVGVPRTVASAEIADLS